MRILPNGFSTPESVILIGCCFIGNFARESCKMAFLRPVSLMWEGEDPLRVNRYVISSTRVEWVGAHRTQPGIGPRVQLSKYVLGPPRAGHGAPGRCIRVGPQGIDEVDSVRQAGVRKEMKHLYCDEVLCETPPAGRGCSAPQGPSPEELGRWVDEVLAKGDSAGGFEDVRVMAGLASVGEGLDQTVQCLEEGPGRV